MPQQLSAAQISQLIANVNAGGVAQARAAYEQLKGLGYGYAGWASGVATGDTIVGQTALDYLQGTALMGLGGDACRNLTPAQIDAIRVDMAKGYLQSLLANAAANGGTTSNDVTFRQAQDFHQDAFNRNGLGLDNWTLKVPMDLLRDAKGDAWVEQTWRELLSTGGDYGDSLWVSGKLMKEVVQRGAFSSDPAVRERSLDWLSDTLGPGIGPAIEKWTEIAGKWGEANREQLLEKIREMRLKAENIFRSVVSPLILDLNGNGVESISINRDVHFDHDGDLASERTGWIGPEDGFLSWDRNSNGRIDSGAELFGNYTPLSSGALATNGFTALATLDSNGDGRLDATDAAFGNLTVWRDANSNGVTDAGELLSLEDAGVASISLSYETSNKVDSQNNERRQLGSFTRTDGTWGQVHDVWFERNNAWSLQAGEPLVDVPQDVLSLPNIGAFGGLVDLHQAMAIDPVLKDLVASFYASDVSQRHSIADSIIMRWTGADRVQFGVDSPYYDERKLFAIDVASGEAVYDRNYNDRPNAGPQAGPLIEAGYDALHSLVFDELNGNSSGEVLSSLLYLIDWESDQTLSAAGYAAKKATDPEGAIKDLVRVVVHNENLLGVGWQGYELLRQELASHAGDAAYVQLLAQLNVLSGSGDISVPINGPGALFGGTGADTLRGLGDTDVLDGGAGDDYLSAGVEDVLVFDAGYGHDRADGGGSVFFGPGATADSIALAQAQNTHAGIDLVVTLSTGDTLTLTDWFQLNASLAESQSRMRFADGTEWDAFQIFAHVTPPGSAADAFTGLALDDQLRGGGGDDTLSGGAGHDVIDGGAGNDWLVGGTGQNELFGGTGNDDLYDDGSLGAGFLAGGVGSDTLRGDSGSDTYYFARGDGQDVISDFDQSQAGCDVLIFGPTIAQTDVVVSRSGNDLLLSIAGSADSVRVSGWFQQVNYRLEAVQFDDGALWATADLVARIVAPATEGNDSLTAQDGGSSIFGLGGNDTLVGGAGNDWLQGDSGNDALEAAGGNDTLVGSTGDDSLYGRAGSDRYVFQRGDGTDVIYDSTFTSGVLNTANDVDRLKLDASPGEVSLSSGGYQNASLVINVASGANAIQVYGWFNQDDNRTLEIEFADGTVWDAAYINARVQFVATSAADYLYGSTLGDSLSGGGGNDSIYGHVGDDTLDGGAGDDRLDGGSGADTYLFGYGSGRDRIAETDSTPQASRTIDAIRIGPGIAPGEVTKTVSGSQVTLTLAGGLDQLTFDQYREAQRIERVIFDDGSQWDLVTNPNGTIAGTAGADNLTGADYDDRIDGQGGNDYLSGGAGNDTLLGGAGNDTLFSGSGLNESDGGAGDDVIYTADGDRVVFGYGYGTDRIYRGYDQKGTVVFQPGVRPEDVRLTPSADRSLSIALAGSSDRLDITYWFNATTQSNTVNRFEFSDGTVWGLSDIIQRISFAGTAGADNLTGLDSADAISGLDGADSLLGGGGDDTLLGGAGNDTIEGGSGNDDLTGGVGNDSLVGGDGIDRFIFSSGFGSDVVSFEAGDRVVFASGIQPHQILVTGDNEFTPGSEGNLYLSVLGTGDKVTLSHWFSAALVPVSVEFADGTIWTRSDLLAKFYALERGGTMNGTNSADSLLGDDGADQIEGFAGNDSLRGAGGDDTLVGGLGDDLLEGGSGTDILLGGVGDDTYVFGLGQGHDAIADYDRATGSHDRVLVGAGVSPADVHVSRTDTDIVLSIGGGQDSLSIRWYPNQGMRIEEIAFADGTVWSAAVLEAAADSAITRVGTEQGEVMLGTSLPDILFGANGDDTILGGTGDDQLHGDAGGDLLNGGYGIDTMIGGSGNDTYIVDSGSDVVFEELAAGIDTVESSDSFVLSDNTENLTLTGGGVNAVGNGLANVLSGTSGLNWIWGLGGDDTLRGQGGGDVLSGGLGADRYEFTAGWGHATIDDLQRRSAQLPGSPLSDDGAIDEIVFDATVAQSTLAFQLEGSDLAIGRNGSADSIYVQDFMAGGTESIDRIRFADGSVLSKEDIIRLASSVYGTEGNDQLYGLSTDSFMYGLGGADVLTAYLGNDLLDGGAGNDTMYGGAGNDVYAVDSSADVVTEYGGNGSDTVAASVTYTLGANVENLTLTGIAAINGTGNALANVLIGNSANNALSGGSGADTMQGGAGDDSYTVDSTADVVVESADEGIDSVNASVTYALAANVEKLALTGTSNLSGTGNASANTLTGNSGANRLDGGDGNDTIDGGAGNDTMIGGLGNDVYYVNVATDVVTEAAGAGTDGVFSSVTLTLAANVENLTLTGTSGIKGTGNALANVLVGNSGANSLSGGDGNDTIDGGAGTDTMVGGLGNDTFYVDALTDVVTEAASGGTDTVMSSNTYTLGTNLENLTLTGAGAVNGAGNSVANALTGNTAANTLTGNAGADTLDGGAGNDSLIGGAGADVYRFGIGDGIDTISENDATANIKDAVQFVGTVTQANVQFTQVGNNLEVLLNGTTDKFVVQNWYLGSQYQVEEFRFTDGTILTNAQAQGQVSAAASMSTMSVNVATADSAATASGTREQIHMVRQPFSDLVTRYDHPTAAALTEATGGIAGLNAGFAWGGALAGAVVAASTAVGRKGIQLPAVSADLLTAEAGDTSRTSWGFAGLLYRGLAPNAALASRWTQSNSAMTTPLVSGDQDSALAPASMAFGRVSYLVRPVQTGFSAILPSPTSPAAGLSETSADGRKYIQPAGSADRAEVGHWLGDFTAGVGLAFGAERWLPDVLAATRSSRGEFDAVTERQTSALVDAMAMFGAGASAMETQAPAAHRVLLENISMPALRA